LILKFVGETDFEAVPDLKILRSESREVSKTKNQYEITFKFGNNRLDSPKIK
jgi:hypothetical protein